MSNQATGSRRRFLKQVGLAGAALSTGMPTVKAQTAAIGNGPRTISVNLQPHSTQAQIHFIHGANGCSKKLLPGFPDLDDQFNAMGVVDIRTHDWFGVCDLDGKIDPANIVQPVFASSSGDKSKAQTLLADIANKRTMVLDAAAGSGLNFAPSDVYLKTVQQKVKNAEILFRIGRSLGASNVFPTSGAALDTYTSLVKQLVQRYGIDYARYGLPRPIKYWEVGNEPDISIFFEGSAGDYNHFFETIFNAIKSVDPAAKVGANGAARVPNPDQQYITGFLDYCNSHGIKLDFFSWHHYTKRTMDPYDYFVLGQRIRKNLRDYRFDQAESFLTEWNMTATVSEQYVSAVQAPTAAGFICSALTYMQDAGIDKAYFYRCDGLHLGMFNQESTYTYAAKAYLAFNQLRATPYRLAAESVGRPPNNGSEPDIGQDTLGFTVLAGTDQPLGQGGARKLQILLSNYQIDPNYDDSYNGTMYRQYAIDISKDADHVDAGLYYGGEDPSQLNNSNSASIEGGLVNPSGHVPNQVLSYSDNNGLILNVNVPASAGYSRYQASFAWITESANLNSAALDVLSGAPAVSGSIPSHGTISISRPELVPGRVLLVTLELS